jgi:hypothetical protein
MKSFYASNFLPGRYNPIFIATTFCVACSSVPPPTEQLAVAQTTVESAASSGAAEYSPVEMKFAQDKLTAARTAVEKEEYETARRLAEQAQLDAKLAETKARASKAQQAVQQTHQGLQTLQNELNRKTQNTAP